jgi:hypothetical protein
MISEKKINQWLESGLIKSQEKSFNQIRNLPPPFNAPPGRVGMEATNELIPFFKPRPEGRGR